MRVVVASMNPAKLRAVEDAFQQQFPQQKIEPVAISVPSGVADQPRSDDETRHGARNRVKRACEVEPDAEFWVGLEGGIAVFDEQLSAFAWMAVRGPGGDISEARSVTLPLPPAVKQLVDEGMELGDANDQVFATVNSKQKGGAYGLLTDGRYTREGIYSQTLLIALVPFVSDLYPHSGCDDA